MKYAGTESLFEGPAFAPPGSAKTGLQVMAVDKAGNAGVHTRILNVGL